MDTNYPIKKTYKEDKKVENITYFQFRRDLARLKKDVQRTEARLNEGREIKTKHATYILRISW